MKSKIAGVLTNEKGIMFICGTDDFHPYECGQKCIHCDKKKFKGHNPKKCALCLG